MPATISDDQLAELVAIQWQVSSLCDDLKHVVDDAMGWITSAMIEQLDPELLAEPSEGQPGPFWARVLEWDEAVA